MGKKVTYFCDICLEEKLEEDLIKTPGVSTSWNKTGNGETEYFFEYKECCDKCSLEIAKYLDDKIKEMKSSLINK